jgi:hypothetical protein
VRIFSITGRSKMAAMIFSSPAPQFGHLCVVARVRVRQLQDDEIRARHVADGSSG